jgi:hypothetical protein
MMSNGDCAGAERYAMERGDFELVGTVRAYCKQVASTPMPTQLARGAVSAPDPANTGPHKVRAKTASGYCLDVPPGYVGTGAENSPAVTSGMPRCDQLSAGR